MQNRMAVVLCNLKPAKRRGVLSQAAVLCARSPDRSEILDPPRRAAPGAKVTAQGFPGEPDTELTPRQKVWKQIQPDLRTDSQCVATYRGSAFEITDLGEVCFIRNRKKAKKYEVKHYQLYLLSKSVNIFIFHLCYYIIYFSLNR
ncbi:aminoacyl tRNA synthase complex-interacting multifunctional protein 1-like isoform X1 [Eleginops maclovinus]|uniref:aminoacyl tRNA synthase complex-interacting multifunctional protein 1-like isoform X1 n=1 Tax=Eleginops maclovinus TaxID=56733 RepID=UPI00307FF843